MKRLKGKTVFATAAAQGIGRATVERMAAEGARVIATDINVEKLKGVAGIEVRQLDVTDRTAVDTVFAEIGAVDVLFNCAGVVHSGSVLDASPDDLDLAYSVNVKSMFNTIRASLPGMLKKGRGSIINIASVASSTIGVPDRCVYGTTKAAVIGLTKSVAADYVKQGIRCNAICPGTVDSPSLHERLRATGNYDQVWRDFQARQKMGRVGQPNEIAALACYLASDEAGFTTGQAINIDGGWTI